MVDFKLYKKRKGGQAIEQQGIRESETSFVNQAWLSNTHHEVAAVGFTWIRLD